MFCTASGGLAPVGLLERGDAHEEEVVARLGGAQAALDRLHVLLLLDAAVLRRELHSTRIAGAQWRT